MVLNHLYMDRGLGLSFKSILQRSTHEDSMLQDNDGLSCSQMSHSKLSPASMEFWVGPRFPSAIKPLLILFSIS